MPDAAFAGFPAEAFEFYDSLADNNNKAWWGEHRGEYERYVRGPLEALLAELSGEFGEPKFFRPYRDVRFSKDKDPIKDHQGAVVMIEDAVGYYVQVSGTGVFVGGGWYSPQGQQLARFRESVDGPAGAELERILVGVRRTFEVDGQPMKTRPRGYDADHARIELLRFRQLTVQRTYPAGPSLGTRKALSTVRRDWRAMRPLLEWLADFVGPGSDPSADS